MNTTRGPRQNVSKRGSRKVARLVLRQIFTAAVLYGCCPVLPAAESGSAELLRFKGREVDLGSFLDALPYDEYRWQASLRHNVLYLLKSEAGKTLIHRLHLGQDGKPAILENARAASNTDLSNSLTYYWDINEADGSLFFIKDENNDESFNLHMLNRSGKLEKLTNVEYVAGYGLSPDGKQVAYSERTGPEGSPIRIHVLDLANRHDRVIGTDSPAQQFTWSELSWQPDGSGVVLATLSDGDRNRGNLSHLSTAGNESQKPRVLTDPEISRTFPSPTRYWTDGHTVLVLSNENGASNLYSLDVTSGAQRALTAFGSDVTDVILPDASQRAILTVTNPLAASVYSLDVSADQRAAELIFKDGSDLTLLDVGDDGEILLQAKSANLPFRIESLEVDQKPGERNLRVVLDEKDSEDIVHCQASPLMYDTFDDLPMTLGEERFRGKIHGYLYSPIDLPAADDRMLLVEAFYGGANEFNIQMQILCAAGIHVFSPAPRGTANISAAFETLNDGDMGGYEVIDVMYGGKFVSEKLGIPAARTGVFGHSHGGYEVMRQLTFPGQVGTVEFEFPWGFGIAEAGFGSIEGQYEQGNIRNWIAKEAGDRTGWDDRSPINYTSELVGNLLLIHGTNDQRVPFAESQELFDRLAAEGKQAQVFLVPLDGVGHGPVARKDIVARYKAWFDFLERF